MTIRWAGFLPNTRRLTLQNGGKNFRKNTKNLKHTHKHKGPQINSNFFKHKMILIFLKFRRDTNIIKNYKIRDLYRKFLPSYTKEIDT